MDQWLDRLLDTQEISGSSPDGSTVPMHNMRVASARLRAK